MLYLADCRKLLRTLPECSVDACVCDPPYGLGFMGKEWDSFEVPSGIGRRGGKTDLFGGAGPGKAHSHGLDPRQNAAFQAWCLTWATEVFRVLKPGAHLLAFGGTRTYHRLACAVEDAGFQVRDCLCWLYGTGFPKNTRLTRFTTKEGLGTALKPAFEPVLLAQKPIEGGVAENVLRWGTGALDIDGCRVDGVKPLMGHRTSTVVAARSMAGVPTGCRGTGRLTKEGRWPANVLLDEVAAAQLDEQSGDGQHLKNPNVKNGGNKDFSGCSSYKGSGVVTSRYFDGGGASRFFYCAKASPGERGENTHPTVKPVALMRWLIRLVTPPGGTVLDPFMGSGSTGLAAVREGRDFVGVEQQKEYFDIAKRRVGAAWQEAR